jgi:hypothetical protein
MGPKTRDSEIGDYNVPKCLAVPAFGGRAGWQYLGVTDAGQEDAPLRGKVEIEWTDGRSGWRESPSMTWSLSADPPVDPYRLSLLFGSLLDSAERDARTEAWEKARLELGVRVDAPADVSIGGVLHDCVAFVPDFGSANGTAILHESSPAPGESRLPSDPFVSRVTDSYARFDHQLFVDTLNDWGWFGSDSPPDWYTGAPWSE